MEAAGDGVSVDSTTVDENTDAKPDENQVMDYNHATRTPPILGETWWVKLKPESHETTKHTVLVFVRMAQMAKPPKGNETEWHVYASQKQVAKICRCSADTVRRAWGRLQKLGLLKKVGGGIPGKVSQFTITGLGFPVQHPSTRAS